MYNNMPEIHINEVINFSISFTLDFVDIGEVSQMIQHNGTQQKIQALH